MRGVALTFSRGRQPKVFNTRLLVDNFFSRPQPPQQFSTPSHRIWDFELDTMAGTKNINKSQKVKQADVKINVYELLDGKDGNPQSPAEHDGAAGYEDEMYFKADEDADEVRTATLLN